MSIIRTPNLYLQGKCVKGPDDYCLITKSK